MYNIIPDTSEEKAIYLVALQKIEGALFLYSTEDDLKQRLLSYTNSTRQTRESRIARKALKDATYARLSGSEQS